MGQLLILGLWDADRPRAGELLWLIKFDYCQIPIQAPPDGQEANFINPPSRAFQIYATAAVCLPLMLIFGGLRLYAMSISKKARTWDDVTFAFAMTCAIFYVAGTVAAIANKPYGLHLWDIHVCEFTPAEVILTLILQSIYGVCIWFVKVSLFILYFVIFGILRWMRISIYLGIGISGVVYLSYMVSFLALCSPHQGTSQIDYLEALDSTTCSSMDNYFVALGAFEVVTDFYLLVLPMFAIWGLKLSRGRKLGVSGIFFTGITACIASIVGLYYRIYLTSAGDPTWNAIPAWLTNFVEITAGVMVCCMPAISSVFALWVKPLVSFLSRSRSGRAILTTTGIGEQEVGRFPNKEDSYPLGRVGAVGKPGDSLT